MKIIKITLSLFSVLALTLAAPMAHAHCGSCGTGDKKHEHKDGEKNENKKGDKKEAEKKEPAKPEAEKKDSA